MDQLAIRGGRRLNGDVRISGAKNAALPELCAALLTAEPVTLTNVPQLQDVATALSLLRSMGVVIEQSGADDGTVHLSAARISDPVAPYELVKTMRASILVLGPLMTRFGEARVSLPGGCAIGLRPVEQHILGLQAMGAEVSTEHGDIVARVPRGAKLRGARIRTDMVTVTGTENLLMAASLADGETTIENAAQEPEVVDLAKMLIAMGARIEGHGSSCIRVQGVASLKRVQHRIVPDRIETGTFLCAVAAAGGDVLVQGTVPGHLQAVIAALMASGVTVDAGSNWLRVRSHRRPTAVSFETSEYPAFPTDMQAQFMALNCIADGTAHIAETIFENRYMHVNELMRLGARVEVDGNRATVHGVARLSGARVMATDLRASASLVIGGLVAEGETVVDRIYHLDRGYERMESKLRGIGADIERRSVAA